MSFPKAVTPFDPKSDVMPCRPDVISCTSDCLKTLIDKLEHLKAVQAIPAQHPQDQAILGLMAEVRALVACLFNTTAPCANIHSQH